MACGKFVNKGFLFLCWSVIVTFCLPAHADQWHAKKGNCDEVFSNYDKAPIGHLDRCTRLWEAYKDVKNLSKGRKSFVAKPFLRLYYEGDRKQANLARGALLRIGLNPGPLPEKPKSILSERPANLPKYQPQPGNRKASQKLVGKGVKMYKKGKYGRALKFYEKAVAKDGTSESALYNAACMHAIQKNTHQAVTYLWYLKDLDTEAGQERLRKARVDKDFDNIRNKRAFKAATGYVRLKLVNGLIMKGSAFGKEEVRKLKETLLMLKYPTAEVADDKHHRNFPIVFYKPEFIVQAEFFRSMLNHKDAIIHKIDFRTRSDVIISWGDTVEEKDGEEIPPPPKVPDPEDFEDGLKDAQKKENDLFRKPDQAADKVTRTARKPDEYEKKVNDMIDRPGKTLKKIEKAGDKIKDLGDKLDF